jgi:hypothetical protein
VEQRRALVAKGGKNEVRWLLAISVRSFDW